MKRQYLQLSAALMSLFLNSVALRAAEDPAVRANLTGRVTDEIGNAIAGATIILHSAKPKSGPATFSPTAYPDCQKRGISGTDGNFVVSSIDPTLKYKVIAVAKGFEPILLKDVDPGKKKVSVVLGPRDPDILSATNRLAGQVFAASGKPLAGALVTVESVEQGGGNTQHGGVSRFADTTLVTDDRGFFVGQVHSPNVVRVGGRLEAPGMAPRWISLKPGTDHLYQTSIGVTVKGRILHERKGVPGVVVGMSSKDRSSGQGFYDLNAPTDAEGRFVLQNIPPDHGYLLYGKMKDLANMGSLSARSVVAERTGSTVDLGDLGLGKSFTLRGQLVLPAGEAVPPRTRVYLGREDAWDSQDLLLDDDGSFEFRGVPAESISLGFRLRGFRLSKKNPSLDWLNGRILGKMDRDIPDFKVLLEKGEWDFNARDESEMPQGMERYPRDLPLRSTP